MTARELFAVFGMDDELGGHELVTHVGHGPHRNFRLSGGLLDPTVSTATARCIGETGAATTRTSLAKCLREAGYAGDVDDKLGLLAERGVVF